MTHSSAAWMTKRTTGVLDPLYMEPQIHFTIFSHGLLLWFWSHRVPQRKYSDDCNVEKRLIPGLYTTKKWKNNTMWYPYMFSKFFECNLYCKEEFQFCILQCLEFLYNYLLTTFSSVYIYILRKNRCNWSWPSICVVLFI